MLSPQLKSQIRLLWDAFWAGGVANPLTAIEQITYLVFLKRMEDLDGEREKNKRGTKQKYDSIFAFPEVTVKDEKTGEVKIIKPAGETFRWSYIYRLPTDERFEHVRRYVFDWLKELEGDDQNRMRDAVFLIPNANLLHRAFEILNDLFVLERNQDTLGDIYEDLLNEIASAGKNGQFRTPRHIIRAMCDLVDVKYGELVCDPACGTGGFLVNAYQHILESNSSLDILRYKEDSTPINAFGDKLNKEEHEELRQNHLHGFDFDRTMVRLGWMNMIQHGMDNPQINYADALGSKFNSEVQEGGKWHEHFDVVLANPPFTGNIDKTDIGETLRPLGTTKTELLFLDLILQLLKPGGRAAVIVPEGVLFGSSRSHLALRTKLVDQTELQAVISLPSGVFQPYAGVKTSILVFVKGGKTENVWFYEVLADGEALNAKRTSDPEHNDLWDLRLKFKLSYGKEPPAFIRPHQKLWQEWQALPNNERTLRYLKPKFSESNEVDNEGNLFPVHEVERFESIVINQGKDWVVSKKEILEDKYSFDASAYKPKKITTRTYNPPGELVEELRNIEEKIQTGLVNLLDLINNKD